MLSNHLILCLADSKYFTNGNYSDYYHSSGLPWWLSGKKKKKKTCLQCRMQDAQSLGREDPLEKEMATSSSILVWEIPWTEEPGGL